MKATDELKREHRGIQRMLAIVGAVSKKLKSGEEVPAGDLDGIAEFLSVFADACHHGKEEGSLFPAMQAAGVPQEGGPIGVMLAEHVRGREIIGSLKQAIEKYKAAEPGAADGIASAGADYIALLSAHIWKEENVLFPLAERVIGAPHDDRIVAEFEKLERERIGAGRHEAFHALLDRLEKAHTA